MKFEVKEQRVADKTRTQKIVKKCQCATMDIIPAMKCAVSLAIGLAVGYASAKIAGILGKVSTVI